MVQMTVIKKTGNNIIGYKSIGKKGGKKNKVYFFSADGYNIEEG